MVAVPEGRNIPVSLRPQANRPIWIWLGYLQGCRTLPGAPVRPAPALFLALTIGIAACASAGEASQSTAFGSRTEQPTMQPLPSTGHPPASADGSVPARSSPAESSRGSVSPTPASPEDDCDEVELRPSLLAPPVTIPELACYGTRTIAFEAQLACILSDVDWFAYEVPSRFLPVYLGRNPPCLVILVDLEVNSRPEAFMTSLPLRVSDRSIVPKTIPVAIRVDVEGHFEDPASVDCRPPVDFPDWPVEEAIQSCRAAFIVTELTSAR